MRTAQAITTTRARVGSTVTAAFAFFLTFAFAAPSVSASPDDLALPKAKDQMSAVDWSAYSSRLVEGIRSSNVGIRQSALRLSIQYAGLVDVTPALLDVMRIYRDNDDERVRHLAVVALASTGNELALGYLKLSEDFESSPAIKRTIAAVCRGDA